MKPLNINYVIHGRLFSQAISLMIVESALILKNKVKEFIQKVCYKYHTSEVLFIKVSMNLPYLTVARIKWFPEIDLKIFKAL